jgi:hypothetical protein
METDRLSYSTDRRVTPTEDNPRLSAFKAGWTEGVKWRDGKYDATKYGENPTLDILTWDALGFRFGVMFGETPDYLRETAYDLCVEIQASHITSH